jgi:hypothetical protein
MFDPRSHFWSAVVWGMLPLVVVGGLPPMACPCAHGETRLAAPRAQESEPAAPEHTCCRKARGRSWTTGLSGRDRPVGVRASAGRLGEQAKAWTPTVDRPAPRASRTDRCDRCCPLDHGSRPCRCSHIHKASAVVAQATVVPSLAGERPLGVGPTEVADRASLPVARSPRESAQILPSFDRVIVLRALLI